MTTDTNPGTDAAAMVRAQANPHLHVPRLIHPSQILERVHGAGAMGRFNAAVALRVTKVVGTMYCAYVFMLIALVALPAAMSRRAGRPPSRWSATLP